MVKELSIKEGGETSVFTNLAEKSEGMVAEADASACNLKVLAQTVESVRLPPHPSVSCRITPTGDAILNLQWKIK